MGDIKGNIKENTKGTKGDTKTLKPLKEPNFSIKGM